MSQHKDDEIERVIFRAERKSGEVTAVFPDQMEAPGLCGCYAHIGQHSACSRDWYYTTRQATPAEYADLLVELTSEPYRYKFRIMRRWN